MDRLDIAHAVNIVSQFVGQPHKHHLTAVHGILQYIRGTLHQGLFYPFTSSLLLRAYADVD